SDVWKHSHVLRDGDSYFFSARLPSGHTLTASVYVDHGARVYPEWQTETWTQCRPIMELLLRTLPAGGSAPAPEVWTEADQDELADGFFRSSYGWANRRIFRPTV